MTFFHNSRRRERAAALLPAFFFLIAACSGGCATSGPVSRPGILPPLAVPIDNVPFHPQHRYQCGPAALASVLNFHGDPVTVEEISGALYRDGPVRGTLSLDLGLYARSRGFSATWGSMTRQELLRFTTEGSPLIVMIDQGFSAVSKHHFLVVVGSYPQGILVHDRKHAYAALPWAKFLGPWERAGTWTLRIAPR